MAEDRESAIDAITRAARDARPRPSRALWIAAAVIAAIAVAAGVVIVVADEAPSSAPTRVGDSGLGFSTGLVVGIVIGIGLGLAIARQRTADRT